MKTTKSITWILLFFLFSCNKKFKHTIPAENTTQSCELCSYADQISGQYRGYAHSQYYAFQDSLTVTLEHIFLNLGTLSDSTSMYFRRIKNFDSKPTKIDTVLIQTTSGNFEPVRMRIFNDSIIIDENMGTHYGPVIVLDFKGKRIP